MFTTLPSTPPPALSTVLARRMAASGPSFNGPPPRFANVHIRHSSPLGLVPRQRHPRDGRNLVLHEQASARSCSVQASVLRHGGARSQLLLLAPTRMPNHEKCPIGALTWDTTNIPLLGTISRQVHQAEIVPWNSFSWLPSRTIKHHYSLSLLPSSPHDLTTFYYS